MGINFNYVGEVDNFADNYFNFIKKVSFEMNGGHSIGSTTLGNPTSLLYGGISGESVRFSVYDKNKGDKSLSCLINIAQSFGFELDS